MAHLSKFRDLICHSNSIVYCRFQRIREVLNYGKSSNSGGLNPKNPQKHEDITVFAVLISSRPIFISSCSVCKMAYSQLAGLRAHQKSARHRPHAALVNRTFKPITSAQRFGNAAMKTSIFDG